jgi:V8-like Glu-specific endopeptidase
MNSSRCLVAPASLLMLVLVASLLGCGGSQAAQYPDDVQIVFIVNDSTGPSVSPQGHAIPAPLPLVPRNSDRTRQLPRAPGAKRQLVVPPYKPYKTPVKSEKPFAADGVVEIADLTQAPFSSGGRFKLNFVNDAPGTYNIRTAQLIGNQGVLLTAAHCAWGSGTRAWGTNFHFDLQYNSGTFSQEYDWQCAVLLFRVGLTVYTPLTMRCLNFVARRPRECGMTINVGAAPG